MADTPTTSSSTVAPAPVEPIVPAFVETASKEDDYFKVAIAADLKNKVAKAIVSLKAVPAKKDSDAALVKCTYEATTDSETWTTVEVTVEKPIEVTYTVAAADFDKYIAKPAVKYDCIYQEKKAEEKKDEKKDEEKKDETPAAFADEPATSSSTAVPALPEGQFRVNGVLSLEAPFAGNPSSALFWVIGGVAVVAIAAGAAFFISKKKKDSLLH